MNKDDQRVRETVQAELRRRRGALDRTEERAVRQGNPCNPGHPGTTNGHNGHAATRLPAEERRQPPRRLWVQPPPGAASETSGE